MASRLDPQFEASVAQMETYQPFSSVPRGNWQQLRQTADAVFAAAATALALPDAVTVSVRETRSDDGRAVGLRWYQQKAGSSGPAVLYIHGGGMISGSAENYDGVVASYVAATGVPMLSVDYALAPEHPYPVPLEDCAAGLTWLIDNAEGLNVDPARIAVMGDSAGGGLAAGLAAAARDRGIALARQILIYPMLDDRRTEVDPAIAPYATWTADNNWTGWQALLGERIGGDLVPALAAPARLTNFSGLPPTYIEVGDLDIFRDESIAFALNLARAGVPLELHVHSGVPHGFEFLAPQADVTARAMTDRLRTISQL
jgi:acetyl esterase/lipase